MGTYRSIEERTLVFFSDNPTYLLEAYADCGEGLDRAGGFAIQVLQISMDLFVGLRAGSHCSLSP